MKKRGGNKGKEPSKVQDLAPSTPEQVTGGARLGNFEIQRLMDAFNTPESPTPTPPALQHERPHGR